MQIRLPSALEAEIGNCVDYYNRPRYHEALDNLAPADVYAGRTKAVLTRRNESQLKTLQQRRPQNLHPLAV